ncbi:MAG: GntR family transcriptional regulator [Candidatus Humimicrobiaceae bacterium]
MNINKINQKNLSEQAYGKIKLLILDDLLKPGEKIIQEKMAERLGISKIPLIQALSVLRNERLIEYHPRKGFFVRKISQQEFYELLEIRGSFESLAVEKISENLNNSLKDRLLDFKQKFEQAVKDKNPSEYFEIDKKFHIYLLEASGNSYLKHINNSFNILLLSYTKGFKTKLKESLAYHNRIIEEILKNHPNKASTLIIEHLEAVKKYF